MHLLCDPRQPWSLILVTNRTSLRDECTRVIELGMPLRDESETVVLEQLNE
jgi:hypothetical protein